MAWGYWTCYNSHAFQPRRTQPPLPFSPPGKRERSLERESGQRHHAVATSFASSSNSADSISKHHHTTTNNHVEPEKVAFERRLLLGDPDWSSRTVADRNTLPRKKQPEYDKSSNSEMFYGTTSGGGRSGKSPEISQTPPDSLSRKSDDVFCPACAQHSQANSNRESRVSFGSVASSSRGSSSARNAVAPSATMPIPIRVRSRSHEDDECSSSRGALSTSLPTPPPPPFSSQRDILTQHQRHAASLMQTINQKMAFLSSFKLPHHPIPPPPQHSAPQVSYMTTNNYQQPPQQQTQQQHHRRSSGRKHTSNSREHSSSSLHSLQGYNTRSRQCDSRHTTRSSTRRSSRSGSRTPRSSRGSRESMGSRGSRGSSQHGNRIRRSSSRNNDDDDCNDEADEDSDNNNAEQKVIISRPVLPPKPSLVTSVPPPPVPPVPLGGFYDTRAGKEEIVAQPQAPLAYRNEEVKEEDRGTVRRRAREARRKRCGSSSGDRDDPTGASGKSNNRSSKGSSLRSSQSQTPDEEEDENARNCRLGGSNGSVKRKDSFNLILDKAVAGGSSNSEMKHFKHYDHSQADFLLHQQPSEPSAMRGILNQRHSNPPARGECYDRPRSASIGNRLSDLASEDNQCCSVVTNNDTRHRRHHTLDGHCTNRNSYCGNEEEPCSTANSTMNNSSGGGTGSRRMITVTSFQSMAAAASSRSVSSKSEKSSSRSSQSPSVENIKYGCNSSKCRTRVSNTLR